MSHVDPNPKPVTGSRRYGAVIVALIALAVIAAAFAWIMQLPDVPGLAAERSIVVLATGGLVIAAAVCVLITALIAYLCDMNGMDALVTFNECVGRIIVLAISAAKELMWFAGLAWIVFSFLQSIWGLFAG